MSEKQRGYNKKENIRSFPQKGTIYEVPIIKEQGVNPSFSFLIPVEIWGKIRKAYKSTPNTLGILADGMCNIQENVRQSGLSNRFGNLESAHLIRESRNKLKNYKDGEFKSLTSKKINTINEPKIPNRLEIKNKIEKAFIKPNDIVIKRIRIGDIRIVFALIENTAIVSEIGDRKNSY